MNRTVLIIAFVGALVTGSLQVCVAQEPSLTKPPALLEKDSINNADLPLPKESKAPSPLLIKAQVLLDREHASPGVIDGRAGENMANAIAAFEATHNLPPDPELSAPVWAALTANQTGPVVIDYDITAKDIAGPFTPNIPSDYAKLAELPHVNYRNVTEMLAERFHMDERLLTALNRGADFEKAGTRILVADVFKQPLKAKIAQINVDKGKGRVQAVDEQGKLIVAYPATVGSDALPSPSGDYKVKGVAWHPVYSYNPQKNFQQGKNKGKLTIASGPNNPVGTVFIALSKPTYGIHGTPDPSKIDKTASHGCVRMTNWDAEELAHMVRAGLPVHFQ